MGQQQSKDELLYQQVSYGNIEGIKSLCRDGARLEWIDRDGKTPLMVASMSPEFYNVAKTLVELGANVNAYRPGRHAGTPLHHAAKRGLETTVKLLLSHGANALVMNDDCQTPLDVAREKGHVSVVRAIENHICLFSGWMREFYGPGFLEAFAPQLLSRKVWVVILPCGSPNPTKPFKLELALYPSLQDARPRAVIALWKANLEEPKSLQSDPSVIILENVTIPRGRRRRRRCRQRMLSQTRIKLAPEKESDWQQLQGFCNACKGIPQHQKSNAPGAVGTSLALETIIQHSLVDLTPIRNEDSISILVCSRGGGGLLEERMELVAELWEENFKAEFVPKSDPSLTEQYEYASEHDIKCLVIIRDTSGSHKGSIKVRHLEMKKEKEVEREDLVKFLSDAMAVQFRNPSIWN